MEGIKKTIEYNVKLSPKELAKLWCEMDGDEQAVFFNAICEESNKWSSPISFQLQFISDSEKLTDQGRQIMRDIGQYGK